MLKRAYSGTAVSYVEGLEKVTGAVRYTHDWAFPGMLTGRFLHSPFPRARITRLDTTAAEAIPGVVAIVTYRDLPAANAYGYIVRDQQIFAQDNAYFVGDIVAAVAAESADAAEAALQAIEVEYDPLPGVYDPVAAMAPDSPLAREDLKSNILTHCPIRFGETQKGFAEADAIVEGSYATQKVEQLFLETEGAIATWDHDSVTVIAGGQYPHRDQIQLADALGISAHQVRVITPYMGGGFGGKDELHTQIQVAVLAKKAGRPVKALRSRYESLFTHVKRHGSIIRYKIGAKADGTLTAIEIEVIMDAGPYSNASVAVVGFAAEMAAGCYDVPNVRIDTYAVATNNLLTGAMRGFGGPQVAYAGEQTMDLLAAKLGMDPLALRMKNVMKKGTVMSSGMPIVYEIGMLETMKQAGEASRWFERDSWLDRQPAPHLRRGLGIATIYHGFGIGTRIQDQTNVTINMLPDGSVQLLTGFVEYGQGGHTALTLMVADELGVPPERIKVVNADTGTTPDPGASTASRMTYMGGNAIIEAAKPIRNTLLELAADELEARLDQLEFGDGVIYCTEGPPERKIEVATLARRAWWLNKPLTGSGHAVMFDPPGPRPPLNYAVPHSSFAYAAHVAQVLVDIETGQVRVEKIWAANDVGRIINRMGIEGQIDGGVMQGVGYALTEELQEEEGQLLNSSLETYAVPISRDLPEIEYVIVEVPDPHGPHGAKGFSEACVTPVAPAIANAVADAIGVRLTQIPMTPERVLAALTKAPSSH